MLTWDDDMYYNEAPTKKTVNGLCINCPEFPETKATRKWTYLEPMCEKHYQKIREIVRTICKNKTCSSCALD